MTMRYMVAIAAAVLVCGSMLAQPAMTQPAAPTAAPAAAAEGIHLKDGNSVSFQWVLSDGLGCRWDISGTGSVDGGTNTAYSGGMQLGTTDGNMFGGGNSRTSESKREIEIGPWQYGNVQVYRRIYVDEKQGYCRWIDIFENNTNDVFRVPLRYRSRMGSSVYEVLSARGTKGVDAKDWAFSTMYRANSSRPAVVHVIAARNSKVKPRIQWQEGSNEVFYFYDLAVEPGKSVALCFFESQQTGQAKAKAYMKDFDLQAEFAKIPAPLQKIILNVSAPTMSLENVEIRRDGGADLAVQRNGDELRGTITNTKFGIKTSFGPMELPAEKVIGISVPLDDDAYVQMILVDGQILAGDLTSPVTLKLAAGNEVKLAVKNLRSVSYKISSPKPAEFKAAGAMVVLRNGQRLYLAQKPTVEFNTLHGLLKLTGDQVSSIQMDTPEGGLHRAIFRNGSVLSGLVTADKFSLKLTLGSTLETSLNSISRIDFPGETIDGSPSAQVQLRNEDALSGQLMDATVDVQTDAGKQTVKLADATNMDFDADNMDMVTIKLKAGTTMTGKMLAKNLKFKVEQGPELSLNIGYITSIAITGSATTEPAPTADRPGPGVPESTFGPAMPGGGPGAGRDAAMRELKAKLDADRAARARNRQPVPNAAPQRVMPAVNEAVP